MTNRSIELEAALRLALEALERCGSENYTIEREAITAIKEALMSVPDGAQQCVCGEPNSAGTHRTDGPCLAPQPKQQEPVAWLHTKIEGVAVPHRPADLDKHPDRWEALYKTPSPCPTCEALARTVMLDQTSYDTTPPQRTWVGLSREDCYQVRERESDAFMCGVAWAESKLKEKNT